MANSQPNESSPLTVSPKNLILDILREEPEKNVTLFTCDYKGLDSLDFSSCKEAFYNYSVAEN